MFLVKRARLASLILAALVAVFAIQTRNDSPVANAPATMDAALTAPTIADDAPEMIAREIALAGFRMKMEQHGGVGCIELADRALCIHPDTSPERVAEILASLPTATLSGANKFDRQDRWAFTATNGGAVGGVGDPITLLWSIVPDGTIIDGGISNLEANLNAKFGSTIWRDRIQNALEVQWGKAIGITYILEVDDGASHPGTDGAVGVRGDVRIGGRFIDGPNGVLAYNYYPAGGGDMVLDTGESTFWTGGSQHRNLRNVVSHENGHGIGFGHVDPENSTKLMEAFFSPAYLGPQDDDIRGGMKNYGDLYENNDTPATATPFDTLNFTGGQDTVRFLSIDAPSDDDWYSFDWSEGDTVSIWVDPVGSTYSVGPDGGATAVVVTDSVFNLGFQIYASDGTTLLATAATAPFKQTEILLDFVLPASPNPFYLLRVYKSTAGGTGIQRYDFAVELDSTAAPVDLSGACCFVDGTCSSVVAADCATAGGTFQGVGVTCGAANCPILVGACCFGDGSCSSLVAADCATAGGNFQGLAVTCEAAACPIVTNVPIGAITDLALTLAPVPVRKTTTASFRVPSAGPVTLEVFDIAGRLVTRLEERANAAGPYAISWDGRDAGGVETGSGVYFLRVSAGALTATERTVVLR
ncbi:MAG: matrixin family metalloprotease [bacterium]